MAAVESEINSSIHILFYSIFDPEMRNLHVMRFCLLFYYFPFRSAKSRATKPGSLLYSQLQLRFLLATPILSGLASLCPLVVYPYSRVAPGLELSLPA